MMDNRNEGKTVRGDLPLKVVVGNYVLSATEEDGVRSVIASSADGGWQVQWYETNAMYAAMCVLMEGTEENEGAKDYLHALLAMMHYSTCYPHDLVAMATKQEMPVISGFFELIKAQSDYELSQLKEASKDEDEEALREVGETQAIAEELERLDEDEAGVEVAVIQQQTGQQQTGRQEYEQAGQLTEQQAERQEDGTGE